MPYSFNPFTGKLDYYQAANGYLPLSGGTLTGNLLISSLTQGSVLFAGASGVITQSNANLFFDAVNSRLGVGIAVPLSPIHLNVNQNGATTMRVSNGSSGSAAQADYRSYNSSGDFFSVGIYSAGTSTYGAITARSAFNYCFTSAGLALMADHAAGNIRFATGGSAEKMRLESNGRLGIGVTGPTATLSLPSDTTAAFGIAFGTDVNLYRSAANTLRTDDTFNSQGGRIKQWSQKSALYTITTTDYGIEVTANTFNVTLPTAVGATGQEYVIKNSGTGVVTLDTTSSQTIDGVTTQILNQYDALKVVSNGANWIII